MKFSTKATYGLRICFLLAVSDKTLSLADIVGKTDLSEKYLEQILGKLRKNGIVGAKRGASGGYFLLKPPSEISVGSILHALDSKVTLAECTAGNCIDDYCPNRMLFKRIYDAVENIVNTTTLEDMIHDYKCVK